MPSAYQPTDRFAFGANWEQFSAHSLDRGAYAEAKAHLHELAETHVPDRRSFLDIGCGSGLFLLAAVEDGFAEVEGFDYDPTCVEVTGRNLDAFGLAGAHVTVARGDVLDDATMAARTRRQFVYAWGSLHHTGDMWRAIRNAAGCVEEGGILLIAIYNRTWSSPLWRSIKRLYVASPGWLRKLLVWKCWIVSALAKWAYTRRNPFRSHRGMNFYYNVVDWVGGYPYEYASVDEITKFVEPLGFKLVQCKRGATPIACNEFVFRRTSAAN